MSSSGEPSEPEQAPGHELSIAIVGANACALTTALACDYAGFRDLSIYTDSDTDADTVSDRQDRYEMATQSVEISPNASRILRTLKTLEVLQPASVEPQFIHQRSYRTGFQLSIQALGAMAEGRYNAPFFHIDNRILCEALAGIAEARGIKRVHSRLTQLSQRDNKVCVTSLAGKQSYDVLIVAADTDHRLRTLANAEPLVSHPSAYTHWHSTIDTQRLPPGAFGPVITQWLGPHHHLHYHFGTLQETGDQQLRVSAITRSEEPYAESSSEGARHLKNAFANWHPSLSALIDSAAQWKSAAVLENSSPERLAHGQILFLASSCHPVLPHLPQQTALGIEDAWVAARMLEQWEEEPASGWIEYEKYRLPRARRMQAQAIERARLLCEPAQGRAFWRNLELSLSSRFLPELAMQKNDWLYGYDAVNGFE